MRLASQKPPIRARKSKKRVESFERKGETGGI